MAPTAFTGNRVALVTGATSGIGEATARAFAANGCQVVLAGRREDRGEAVVAEIVAGGGVARFVRTDLRDASQIGALVRAAFDAYGRLDFAFNNAGTFDRSHLVHEYDDDAWDDMIAINLTAVFRCMKHEIAAMLATDDKPAGGCAIVNNASTVAHRGSTRAGPAYVASKHAVVGLTRQAAVQYVSDGIRVNAVSPGPTLTEVSAPLVAEGPEAVQAALTSLNPTAEFVTPDEVAHAVLFLCSDAAAMINGHDIPLDGGQLASL